MKHCLHKANNVLLQFIHVFFSFSNILSYTLELKAMSFLLTYTMEPHLFDINIIHISKQKGDKTDTKLLK